MTTISFRKGHALGNDYLVLLEDELPFALSAAIVRRLCDRHLGVGGDGIVSLSRVGGSSAEAVVWNADGSTAEVSGNGLRIAAIGLDHAGTVELTSRGIIYLVRARDDGLVEIHLPPATIGSLRTAVEVDGRSIAVTEVSVGNPHAVVEAEAIPAADWPAVARGLERHQQFPEGANVERVRPTGDGTITVELHERGVGPTEASGTGASAAAAAAVALGLVASGEIRVAMAGGELHVTVTDHGLTLAGAVSPIYRGTLESGFVRTLAEL